MQKVICPEVLHEDVIVVKGRLVLFQEDSEIQRPENCNFVTGSTGEKVWLVVINTTAILYRLRESSHIGRCIRPLW